VVAAGTVISRPTSFHASSIRLAVASGRQTPR
jgi:hypothetical protein